MCIYIYKRNKTKTEIKLSYKLDQIKTIKINIIFNKFIKKINIIFNKFIKKKDLYIKYLKTE